MEAVILDSQKISRGTYKVLLKNWFDKERWETFQGMLEEAGPGPKS